MPDEPDEPGAPAAPPPLPPPRLVGAASAGAASVPSLEQLLEQASRSHAADFAGKTLIGECLDTHNPHLPRRALIRARGQQGGAALAWLALAGDLEVRPGTKVLLDKPDNWPEPVIIGVIEGLETPSAPAAVDESALELGTGERLIVADSEGRALLEVWADPNGARVRLCREVLQREGLEREGLEVQALGHLRLAGGRLELRAGDGGLEVNGTGDGIVRAKTIRLN